MPPSSRGHQEAIPNIDSHPSDGNASTSESDSYTVNTIDQMGASAIEAFSSARNNILDPQRESSRFAVNRGNTQFHGVPGLVRSIANLSGRALSSLFSTAR